MTVYPGQVFCTALPNNGTVNSTDTVVVTGTSEAYLIGADSVTLQIAGLNALSSYASYCYLETAQGVGNSLQEVLQTRRVHTTACCKSLTFTNLPASLYGDSTKYPADQTSRYVFSYALGSAPYGALTVTPTFTTARGAAVTTIAVSPASAQFTSTSTLLTSNFIISIDPALFVTGDYVLTLELSGPSKDEYYPVTSQVLVLASNTPPSPPALQSAMFLSDG